MTLVWVLIFPVVQTENVQLLNNLNIKPTMIFVALSNISSCRADMNKQTA